MRTLATGLLGALAGLLAAIVLQDVLARLVSGPDGPGAGSALLGMLLPVLVIGGAIAGPVLDRRRSAGR